MRQWTDVLLDARAGAAAALTDAHIGTRNFWHPLHTQPPYAAAPDKFPHSSDISRRGLWLASRLDLSESDIDYAASATIAALRR